MSKVQTDVKLRQAMELIKEAYEDKDFVDAWQNMMPYAKVYKVLREAYLDIDYVVNN